MCPDLDLRAIVPVERVAGHAGGGRADRCRLSYQLVGRKKVFAQKTSYLHRMVAGLGLEKAGL